MWIAVWSACIGAILGLAPSGWEMHSKLQVRVSRRQHHLMPHLYRKILIQILTL